MTALSRSHRLPAGALVLSTVTDLTPSGPEPVWALAFLESAQGSARESLSGCQVSAALLAPERGLAGSRTGPAPPASRPARPGASPPWSWRDARGRPGARAESRP